MQNSNFENYRLRDDTAHNSFISGRVVWPMTASQWYSSSPGGTKTMADGHSKYTVINACTLNSSIVTSFLFILLWNKRNNWGNKRNNWGNGIKEIIEEIEFSRHTHSFLQNQLVRSLHRLCSRYEGYHTDKMYLLVRFLFGVWERGGGSAALGHQCCFVVCFFLSMGSKRDTSVSPACWEGKLETWKHFVT